MVLHDTNGDGEPDEILVMDSPAVETAVKIWRWNSGGFGYSENGYNGPYETAITMDGTIIGKFIAGLTIAGSQIISGIIKSETRPEVYFDLDVTLRPGRRESALRRVGIYNKFGHKNASQNHQPNRFRTAIRRIFRVLRK